MADYKHISFQNTEAFCVKVFQGYGFSEEKAERSRMCFCPRIFTELSPTAFSA